MEFDDPNVKDVVVEDTKQLGVHFTIDLQEEDSYLTYEHWYDDPKGAITKRKVARKFAKAWNLLQEMSAIRPRENMFVPYLEDSEVFGEKIGAS